MPSQIEEDYIPYTATTVRAILDQWPQFEAAKQVGLLTLHSPVVFRADEDQVKAWNKKVASEMFARPMKKTNRVYRADATGIVIIDVERALAKLKPFEYQRLKFYYLFGYSYAEIGAKIGLTEHAIKSSCDVAINKMAQFLEKPAKAKLLFKELPPRETDHNRKYKSFPGS